ncbi:hypothetical protein [Kitasatospora purpeofusca]|uniref:hypothetical protein n=1 Tax=Kitasatospora purpeofusca TaxID=67352 RepID=UPI002A5A60CD|nr:hypothetical protein [Kitasatospora purpeofusca]MDY0812221.1 hypothetical protein [Kitasatospora purpeofusca]
MILSGGIPAAGTAPLPRRDRAGADLALALAVSPFSTAKVSDLLARRPPPPL